MKAKLFVMKFAVLSLTNKSAVVGLVFLAFVALSRGAPILPNINTNNIITITNAPYNAKGDGTTDNTLAISNAIVAAAKGVQQTD